MNSAADLIAKEEGFRSHPYLCSEDYPTVGYGQKIGPKNADIALYQFEIPEPVARLWLESHIVEIMPQVTALVGPIDGVRQAALASMIYQLGYNGVAKFRKMIAAVKAKNWQEAKAQALDSRWAKQTPERALRNADMLLTGEWPK